MSLDLHVHQIDARHNSGSGQDAKKESGFYDEVFVRFGSEIRHFRYYSRWEKWVQQAPVSSTAVSGPLIFWRKTHNVSATVVAVIEDRGGTRGIQVYYRDWLTGSSWRPSSFHSWRIGEELSGVMALKLLAEGARCKIDRSRGFFFAWDFHYQALACIMLDMSGQGGDSDLSIRWEGPRQIGPSVEDAPGGAYYRGDVVGTGLPWTLDNSRLLLTRGAALMQCRSEHDATDRLVAEISPAGGVTDAVLGPPAMVAIAAKRRIEMVVPQPSGLSHYFQEDGRNDWQVGARIPCKLTARPHLICHPYLNQICMVVRDGSDLRSFIFDWESRKEWREGPSFGRQVVGEPALYMKQDYRDGTLYPMAAVREATDSIQFYRYDMRHGHWSSAMF